MARDPSSSGRRPSEGAEAHAGEALEDFARRVRDQPTLRSLDAATVELFDAFAAAGVDALLLKGPTLARLLYTEGEYRSYSDVDLLVAPDDLSKARGTLAGLGYKSVSEALGLGAVPGVLDAETWAPVGMAATTGLAIDLHWRLDGSEASPQVGWIALRRQRTWIELNGCRLPTLHVDGLALHLALHAAQHGTRYPKPIEDLTRGLERWPAETWRGAAALAAEMEAVEAFAAGLRLVPPGAALADDLELPATDERLWAIAHSHARPRGTFHLEAFARARTLRERGAVLRKSLFPRREWIAWQYRWARRGGVRLMVSYALHLTRAPVWAARGWLFRRRVRRSDCP